MKKHYETANIQFVSLNFADVLTASGTGNGVINLEKGDGLIVDWKEN